MVTAAKEQINTQWNRRESFEINLCVGGNWIYHKSGSTDQWRAKGALTMWCWRNLFSRWRTIKLFLCNTIQKGSRLRWRTESQVKSQHRINMSSSLFHFSPHEMFYAEVLGWTLKGQDKCLASAKLTILTSFFPLKNNFCNWGIIGLC